MIEAIEIKFDRSSKGYYFSPNGLKCFPGDKVIVCPGGFHHELVTVSKGNFQIPDDTPGLKLPLSRVIAKASKEDGEIFSRREYDAKQLLNYYHPIMKQSGIKLIAVKISLDGRCVTGHIALVNAKFTPEAEAEIKSRFPVFNVLRPVVNSREETRLMGGTGVCGREFCCSSGICTKLAGNGGKLAEEQGLKPYSEKIFGGCGQHLCCLRYEIEMYRKLAPITPKIDERVRTPEGMGKIIYSNAITGQVRVLLDVTETPELRRKKEKNPDYTPIPKVFEGKRSDIDRLNKPKTSSEPPEIPKEISVPEIEKKRGAMRTAAKSAVVPGTPPRTAPVNFKGLRGRKHGVKDK